MLEVNFVVKILNKKLTCGFATGFFVSKNCILTCNHCIEGFQVGESLKIEFNNIEYDCVVAYQAGSKEKNDLALIETSQNLCNDHAVFSNQFNINDAVLIKGFSENNPGGDGLTGFIESYPTHKNEIENLIKFKDCQITNGFSGSPLLNKDNSVLGIVIKSRDVIFDLGGYSIPTIQIQDFYKKITVKNEPTLLQKYNYELLMNLSPNINDERYFKRRYRRRKDGQAIEMDSILDLTNFVLTGIGGSGKSITLQRICKNLLVKDNIVIYLDLKKWQDSYIEGVSKGVIENSIEIILKTSLVGRLSIRKFNKILEENENLKVFFLIDGLNEISGSVNRIKFIETLGFLQGRDYNIIATDREIRIELDQIGNLYELELLDEETLAIILKENFGKELHEYSEKNKRFLTIAFFLDKVISKQGSDTISSYSDFIETHTFKRVSETDKSYLKNKLSELAYSTIRGESTTRLSFTLKQITDNQLDICIEHGILIKLLDSDIYRFEHQLIHEFFVARHLSLDSSLWNNQNFDSITLESDSFETILMILEQLGTDEQKEKFLQTVYNWSFYAVLYCMKYDINNCPESVSKVILLILSEKLFDPFNHTKLKVGKYILPLFDRYNIKYDDSCKELKDVINKNRESLIHSNYSFWFQIFQYDKELNEEFINQITHDEPFIGWTVSNVIRRYQLTESDEYQLRTIYHCFSNFDGSNQIKSFYIKWRVIHSLGKANTIKSVDLLFSCFNEKESQWMIYGALRSLIEIIVYNKRTDFSDVIFAFLFEYIKGNKLTSRNLEELTNCLSTKYTNNSKAIKAESFFLSIIELYSQEEKVKNKWEKGYENFKRLNY